MATVYAVQDKHRAHIAPVLELVEDVRDVALVAGFADLLRAERAGHRRIALMQHGAGQSYTAAWPAYPGGDRNDSVGLFLCPNEHSAGRWRARYPSARVAVVGCPRLDSLPTRIAGPGPVVALSFHFDARFCPEGRSAFDYYSRQLPTIAERYATIGHSHPARPGRAREWRRLRIEFEPDFEQVCRRADVYVCDNSSTLFEFAATGRPVVVLNDPRYRRGVSHGLRFWEAASVGVQVDRPQDLAGAVERALELRPEDVAAREAALDIVYARRSGAAQAAAAAIREWAA